MSNFLQKTFCFSWEKNQQFRQTPFYVSGRILRDNFLLSTFVTFSNFEQRFFCLLAKTYEQWFQSCILRSHRIFLMGFFGKKLLFWIIFRPWAEALQSSGKTFQQGCRNSIIRVHSSILRSNVFLNFFLSFPDDERTILAFSWFFPTGLSELHYTRPPVKIELKLCSFEGNAFFHLFRTLSKKFLACWQNFFGGFIKTAFYVSIGTLWGEKLLFWKIRIFITLGHWANHFRFLVAKISIRLWELHSKGPENHFEENFLFLKRSCCQFRTLSETFLVFSRDFISKFVKTALYETTKKLERICFEKFS